MPVEDRPNEAAEIVSDGTTIWINTAAGTIARFGRLGIDVHSPDTSTCLYCTHGATTEADWHRFRLAVLTHHGIPVGDQHMPTRFLA